MACGQYQVAGRLSADAVLSAAVARVVCLREADPGVELKIAVLELGSIHLGSSDGAELTVRALPYLIPEPA